MAGNTWFRIHSFTGVITGLLLFVIVWSGSFAVIANEIDWLVTPETKVTPGETRASWGTIKTAVEAAYPESEVRGLQAPLYPRSAAQVVIDRPHQQSVLVYVDPYTAEIRGAHSAFNLQHFFRLFHKQLFLPPVGLYLITVFALQLLLAVLAALCFFRRWWARFFQFKIGRGRVLWSAVHKTVGLWSLWFLLVIGLTGGWYLFEKARSDIGDGKTNYVGDPRLAVHAVPTPTSDRQLPLLSLDTLATRVKAIRPDLRIQSIRLTKEGVFYVEGQAGHWLVRDRANQVHLDARTGKVLYSQRATDLPLYWRWSDTADPLHFGDFGGLTSKMVWFAFGLALSGLCLTGIWLHARRLAHEAGKRPRHRWPGNMAAILISLVVLAAAAPFGIHHAREFYGPTVDGVKQLPTLAPGVKAVIIGWIAVTLAIIAGWVWLLWRPLRVHQAPRRSSWLRPG